MMREEKIRRLVELTFIESERQREVVHAQETQRRAQSRLEELRGHLNEARREREGLMAELGTDAALLGEFAAAMRGAL